MRLNTVAYALGAGAKPTTTLSIARDGNDVVLTYTGGMLESADALVFQVVIGKAPA